MIVRMIVRMKREGEYQLLQSISSDNTLTLSSFEGKKGNRVAGRTKRCYLGYKIEKDFC